MKQGRVAFIISFDRPSSASVADCKNYVIDAVKTYRGSLRPPNAYDDGEDGDPMWPLNTKSIKVAYKLPGKRRHRNIQMDESING